MLTWNNQGSNSKLAKRKDIRTKLYKALFQRGCFNNSLVKENSTIGHRGGSFEYWKFDIDGHGAEREKFLV